MSRTSDAEASPRPLPSVNYPSQPPDPAGPRPLPSVIVPDQAVNDGPTPYVLVGGVWGYWDRGHVFHPVSAAAARSGVVRPPAVANDRVPFRGQWVPRAVVHLPNAASGRIVTGQSAAVGRGSAR